MAAVTVLKLSELKALACEIAGCSDGHTDACPGSFATIMTAVGRFGSNIETLRLGAEFANHCSECETCRGSDTDWEKYTPFAERNLCAYARALCKAGEEQARK